MTKETDPQSTEEYDALFAAITQSNMPAATKQTVIRLLKDNMGYLLADVLLDLDDFDALEPDSGLLERPRNPKKP